MVSADRKTLVAANGGKLTVVGTVVLSLTTYGYHIRLLLFATLPFQSFLGQISYETLARYSITRMERLRYGFLRRAR